MPKDLQAAIETAATELVAAGTETGLQIAVRRHGRVVADVTAGLAVAVMRDGPPAGLAAVTRIDRIVAGYFAGYFAGHIADHEEEHP